MHASRPALRADARADRFMPVRGPSALAAPLVFRAGATLGESTMGEVALVTLSGLVSPLVFAWLPGHAGACRPDDPRIATAMGCSPGSTRAARCSGRRLAASWGWPGPGAAVAVLALAMRGMLLLAEALYARGAAA